MTSGSEFRLGVGDLLHRPGTRRTVDRVVMSDELRVAGSMVPAGSPISVNLVVESTADPGMLTVSGTLSAPWVGECRRCLGPIEGDLETEVHEVFARIPVDDDIWPLEDEEIDLGAVIRESMLLAVPLAPLCRADCRGPAPEEFPALTEADSIADEEQPPADPRWAALDQLRFED